MKFEQLGNKQDISFKTCQVYAKLGISETRFSIEAINPNLAYTLLAPVLFFN